MSRILLQHERVTILEAAALLTEYAELQHDERTTCVEQGSRESAALCMIEKRKALKCVKRLMEILK